MPMCTNRILCVTMGCLMLGYGAARCEAKKFRSAKPPVFSWTTSEISAPRIEYQAFDSKVAKAKVSYHIYTPKRYSTATEQRFPVLYWLQSWGSVETMARYFDVAIEEGKILPMLIVFPNNRPRSMWCNSKDGRVPMETMLVTELLPHVDRTFRTLALPEGRMVEGVSLGGYGAARLGFKYPDLFGAVSILSGGPLQREFTITPRASEQIRQKILKKTYGNDQAYFTAQSPWVLAQKKADQIRRTTYLRQVIGSKDAMLHIQHQFDAHLTELKIPHAFIVLPGVGHYFKDVLSALGEDNWAFYRRVFGSPRSHE